MCRVTIVLLLYCLLAADAESKSAVGSWPRGGTINVVVANNNGIVVLTDSMLTEFLRNSDGSRTERQLKDPGQKLFRIDDKTVCAFAGFASAPTAPLPEYLNSVPLIIGRYLDSLKGFESQGPVSFSDKLSLLEGVAAYYLTGIANIRGGSPADDYDFELFLVGYDLDGAAQIGTLEIGTVSEQIAAGQLLKATTVQKSIVPIKTQQEICIHGIESAAREILNTSGHWKTDVGPCEQSTDKGTPLSVEQMRILAISLKEKTASQFREVGGPNQIAVLTTGHIQGSIEQPVFPPLVLSKFKFQMLATVTSGYRDEPGMPLPTGKPTALAFMSNGFTLVLADQSTHMLVNLDNSYFAKSVFQDCVLRYRGGEVHLEKSNQVIDSDLEIAEGVNRSSPQLQKLIKDFKWRRVTYGAKMAPPTAIGMVFDNAR